MLADDQILVRAGFRSLLETEDGIEVVGEADNGAGALAVVRETRPDVVLMDIRMPIEVRTRLVDAGADIGDIQQLGDIPG